MKNIALLILRVTVGALLAGHGAQKLFGWFGGPGLKGTKGFMESLGLSPSHIWGPAGAFGEFSGGVLTALGLFNPIGPQNIMSMMAVATRRVHWKNGVWNSANGFELPLTNLAVGASLALMGPGKYSLDRMFGIRLPKWFVALTWLNHVAVTGAALFRPELVQAGLNKVTGGSVAHAPSAEFPLQVETRPVPPVAVEKQRAGK
ncbi:MAG: DoxX family protein [Chloroflexota bacterium]